MGCTSVLIASIKGIFAESGEAQRVVGAEIVVLVFVSAVCL